MSQTSPSQRGDPTERAIGLVAEAVGELMEFWNFKPSMGRVWTVLYLSQTPLSADILVQRTGLSAGSISMTLNELQLWGVVKRAQGEPGGGRRKRMYVAETDILSMVTRVFRERELRQVRRSVELIAEAARILDQEAGSHHAATMLRTRFVATRVGRLLELARLGEKIIDRFGSSGEMDLRPIRDWLGVMRRR